MPVLFGILGKVLVLTDALLNYFVTATGGYSVITQGACGSTCNIVALDYEMTGCGTQFFDKLICLVDMLVNILPGLLGALFAY
jgi:hypothetical protein